LKDTPFKKLIYILPFALLVLHSCGTPYQPEEEKPEDKEEQEDNITDADSVPPDATLEAVTWNLEWYGTGFSGPSDQEQQTKKIVQVLDSLNADLYTFQEVHQQEDLDDIVQNLTGFRGFIADYIGQSQKMAIAYNTQTIDSLSAGPITNQQVRQEYRRDWTYYWASGRLPLYFSFNYTYQGTTEQFYAVVIHGISNYGDDKLEDYQRRKKAAEGLFYYLQDRKPDAHIILLGDYNDDVDVSIYDNSSQTPYYPFVNNSKSFDVISKKLSEAGQSSTVNYNNVIDHITISNELESIYVTNSTEIYTAPQSYITDYGETTSDHWPVWAKFDVTKQKSFVLEK
jgi:endonuclease/exonuclease/phosphatase family metal-dependent hydrolase